MGPHVGLLQDVVDPVPIDEHPRHEPTELRVVLPHERHEVGGVGDGVERPGDPARAGHTRLTLGRPVRYPSGSARRGDVVRVGLRGAGGRRVHAVAELVEQTGERGQLRSV